MRNTIMVENLLGKHQQKQYSTSFRRMMNKALDRIYKKKIVQKPQMKVSDHIKQYRILIPVHQRSIYMQTEGHQRSIPFKSHSLFRENDKESTRYGCQKRSNIKLLDSLSKGRTDQSIRINREKLLQQYRKLSYQKEKNSKCVEQLISDIKNLIKKPLPANKKTLNTQMNHSLASSRVRKCKLQRRQPHKKISTALKTEKQQRRAQTEGSHWEPWQTDKQQQYC